VTRVPPLEPGDAVGDDAAMSGCAHLEEIRDDVTPGTPDGCAECLAMGSRWVQLRECLTCGHVGCCDSSPHRHATAHFHTTRHPIIRSFQPGESWRWCYVDERVV
jgi:CPA1 family monovalent cation:H+ antiporter